jgi:uncharacterized damage-inducible protein DinB
MAAKEKLTEAARIADQLRRAFDGDAWHGPALSELLEDLDAAKAAAKPIHGVHSIWELLLHIEAWDRAAIVRLQGKQTQPEGDLNFQPVTNPTKEAWHEAVSAVERTHDELIKVVEALPDSRLYETVPGKPYDFYHNLHGVVQHELYHAGQIAILKKAQGR